MTEPAQTDIEHVLQELRETRRTLSELVKLVRTWRKSSPRSVSDVPDVELDALVTQRVTGQVRIPVAVMHSLFPDVSRRAIAASLVRLGWTRRRTSTARFWVAPVTAPASAAAAT